jgi:zinc transport system substrate-binding protein
MRFRSTAALPAFALATMPMAATPALAAPAVVADIAPIQSIAARVMQGVGAPEVLLPPGSSPHDFSLRPSDARTLEDADVVFWVGPELTPWLADPISALAGGSESVALEHAPSLTILPFRAGIRFDAHDTDRGGEREAAAAHRHAADNEETAGQGEGGHHPDHSGSDPHVWLDPQNGAAIARAMAETLARVDPEHASRYAANAHDFAGEMIALEQEIAAKLEPVSSAGFVVFHDGFHYFEHRFGVEASGALSLGDGARPSAARVAEIRDGISDDEIACVFSEPQFSDSLVDTVLDGTAARHSVLDPVGARLTPGPDLYPALLSNIAEAMASCLRSG